MEFKVPELGEGVESATVAGIRVQPGAAVKAGEPLLELETGKATVDVPAPEDGRVERILVKPGDPANSFLVTKLRSKDPADPLYGPGQPAPAPGSICAAAVDVIAQWIAQGAPNR